MAAADAPSFWSRPVMATRAYFARQTPLQAIGWTLTGTMGVTLAYLWWRGDVFGAQAFTGLYMVAINLVGVLQARLERPGDPARGLWIAVGCGVAVVAFAVLGAWAARP